MESVINNPQFRKAMFMQGLNDLIISCQRKYNDFEDISIETVYKLNFIYHDCLCEYRFRYYYTNMHTIDIELKIIDEHKNKCLCRIFISPDININDPYEFAYELIRIIRLKITAMKLHLSKVKA